jgi:RNA polymerase sigma factor (sigma-70 family)
MVSPTPPSDSGGELDLLLDRMRNGDREAVGEFVATYGERVRIRVRGRLGPAMRRLFDSHDVLSTVSRRLDDWVREGRLQATSTDELWSFVMTTTRNAIMDRHRVLARLRRVEGEDGEFARVLAAKIERDASDLPEANIAECLDHLDDELDRLILARWLAGASHAAIAQAANMPPASARKRWQRIKAKLGEFLRDGGSDGST